MSSEVSYQKNQDIRVDGLFSPESSSKATRALFDQRAGANVYVQDTEARTTVEHCQLASKQPINEKIALSAGSPSGVKKPMLEATAYIPLKKVQSELSNQVREGSPKES